MDVGVTTPALGLFVLIAAAVLLGWTYFHAVRVPRPPLGVMTIGDVVVLIGGVVLIPYAYLALPAWSVGALLALGTLTMLQLLLEPMLPGQAVSWLLAAALVAADLLLAWRSGTTSLAFLAVNNLLLILVVVAVTNVWAQSGLKARDLAILAAALTAYDLLATAWLPLTSDLITRLAGMPFMPMLAWPVGNGRWVGVGLGDLLLATAGPLVLRKAFGRRAGFVAMAVALGTMASLLVAVMSRRYAGIFPAMVLLGPLLLIQYLAWRHVAGAERTMRDFLQKTPAPLPHVRNIPGNGQPAQPSHSSATATNHPKELMTNS